MRTMIVCVVMFCSLTSFCVAQEPATTVELDESIEASVAVEIEPVQAPEGVTQENVDEVSDEWKPRFLVTVRLNKSGSGRTIFKKVEAPYYRTKYEDLDVTLFDEGFNAKTSKARVAVQELAYRTIQVQLQEPGLATLLCDEISLTIAKSESSNYEFECPGRLTLQIGGLLLDAESASHKNGELKLTSVEITQGVTTATADNLTLPLPVWGLTTADYDLPVQKYMIPPTLTLPRAELQDPNPRPDGAFRPSKEKGFPEPSSLFDDEREFGVRTFSPPEDDAPVRER